MPEIVTGRAAELSAIRSVLQEVARSTAQAVVVEGAAGIGKTTVIQAGLAEAHGLGFATMGARAEELEQERSFGTILEALRSTESAGSGEPVRDLPEDATAGESEFHLIDRLVEFVESTALGGPTLLWFDDLQWADDWSTRAIGILRRRLSGLPLAILIGTRPLQRSPQAAACLRVLLDGGLHVQLGPLDEEAVADLVRNRSAADPSPRLQAALRRAGGNPFFVRELYDAFERDGLLHGQDGEIDVYAGATPSNLLVTVLHRMSGLPEDCLELLRVAAVLGGSFTVKHLAVAAASPEDGLLEPLRRLRTEGLLTEEGDLFRFRHDLLREAVYEDLGGPVRVAMHSRIAHVFAAAGVDLTEIAHHLLRGAQPGDLEAAELMIAATESGQITLRECVALLRRVLEIAPLHPRAGTLKRSLARLLHMTDRPADAIPLLEELLAGEEDPAQQLLIVASLGVAALRAGEQATFRSWRARAAQLASGLADSWDPEVLLSIAQCHFDKGDLVAAHATAARAIPLAREKGLEAQEENAEGTCSWLLSSMGFPRRAMAHSDRALSLSKGRATEPMRWIHKARAHRSLWEETQARSDLATALRRAGESGAVALHLRAVADSSWLYLALGNWDEATLHADTAVEMMRELGITSDANHPNVLHAWVALRRADVGRAAALIETATDDLEWELHGPWIQMIIATSRGDTEGAAASAARLLENRTREGQPEPYCESAFADMARAALAAGDKELAHAAWKRAEELGEGVESFSPILTALRCRAIVSEDRGAAMEALELAKRCPWPLEQAATFEDVSGVFGDRREELLRAAASIYDEAGATLDYGRVAAAVGGRAPRIRRPARPVTGWDALTEAERKVVDLAARGLTNREIGEQLFISHRTAGTHLSRAFDKLQVRSRVELAHQAAQQVADASA